MRQSPLFIPVSPAGFALIASVAAIASAQPAFAGTTSISGYVVHCDTQPRSVILSDVVQVNDGRRTYAAQLNTDGSYALAVDESSSYTISVFVSGRTAPVRRLVGVPSGPQPLICLSRADSS